MKLSEREFNAMQAPLRRLLQRSVEYPAFKRMGLDVRDADVLEIGCGSGYGAQLLFAQSPRSYEGIDLMPEQVALAVERHLPQAAFRVADATDLGEIPDASKDIIVIFGVLHHIPEWRKTIRACARILRPGGRLFVEEPDGGMLERWERIFHWGHPNEILRLKELEHELQARGFTLRHRLYALGFGTYAAQRN